VAACYIADVRDVDCLTAIVPEQAAGIIIDLGDSREASILVTHKLKQLGHNNIMVRAESAGHGEIVSLLGAKKVVFPDREAAKRLVPSLVSHGLISYTPMGRNMAFAEVATPEHLFGKTVIEANFRSRYNLNLIAVRAFTKVDKEPGVNTDLTVESDYQIVTIDFNFAPDVVLLVAGTEKAIQKFADDQAEAQKKTGLAKKLSSIFRRW
jgi:trk system potassium uptake protein